MEGLRRAAAVRRWIGHRCRCLGRHLGRNGLTGRAELLGNFLQHSVIVGLAPQILEKFGELLLQLRDMLPSGG